MDKKEIIIDGVKVSRCKHYDIDNNYCDQSYLGESGLLKNTKNPKKCESSPNCYYKQLKRTQQEIEKYSAINEQLQKRFNDYQNRKIEENANLMKKLDIADKKLTVFSRELERANKENERLRKINHEFAEEHKTIGQDLYAEIKNYRKEKENLKEENAILRKFLNQYQEEANALKSYETYKVWLNNEYRKENEKLKQQLEIDKNQINYFIQENEKQKEQIKQLEDFIKSDGEIDHINHEYTYKLKKVLQEVKSIAKGVRGYLEVPAPRDVRFEMDRILDLITKVQESEER